MKPSISEAAEWELTEAARVYADASGIDLGAAFLAEFERCLDMLCDRPKLGVEWEKPFRRFPMRRFPYSIIYQLDGEELKVEAVAHRKRCLHTTLFN